MRALTAPFRSNGKSDPGPDFFSKEYRRKTLAGAIRYGGSIVRGSAQSSRDDHPLSIASGALGEERSFILSDKTNDINPE
jgi:hypothetical protein